MFDLTDSEPADPARLKRVPAGPSAERGDPEEDRRRGAILEAVAFGAERLLRAESWREGLDSLLERLGRAAQVDLVALFQKHLGPEGDVRRTLVAEWSAAQVPKGDPLAGLDGTSYAELGMQRWAATFEAGGIIQGHVRDLPASERPFLEAAGIRSLAIVPVYVEGEWWGAVGFSAGSEREWSPAEVGALRVAAGLIGTAVQRELAESALREAHERYRTVVDLSPDAMFVHRGGVITMANAAAARLLGASSPDQLVGESFLRFVHADSRPLVLTRLQQYREGRLVPPAQEKLVRFDGSSVDVEVAATPVQTDGASVVQVVARDITDRKRAERAVRESEARKSAILESALDAVITMDHEGRIREFNPAAEEMFGRRRSAVLGERLDQLLIPPSLRDRHRRGLQRYLATGGATILGRRVELSAMRADGSEFPIELAVARVEVPGDALFTAYIRDITDRIRSEEALRESEDRYRRLVEMSPDAIMVHSEGRFVFANSAAARLLGAAEADELVGRPMLDVVHPDYWELVANRARQETEAGLAVPLIEEKFVRLDGAVIDVEVAGIPFTFEGRPAGQIVIRDITDRKRIETALRQRGEYLSALHDTALGLMNRLDLHDLLQAIVGRAAGLVGTPDGCVYLLAPEGDAMEMHVGVGAFHSRIGERTRFGEGMAGKVWELAEPVMVEDYARWDGRAEEASILHGLLAAPLKSGTQVLGVIAVAHTQEGRLFSEEDVALIDRFAKMASIALDNATLYTQAQDQLAQRERAERQLREAEAQFRSLVERIPAITYSAEFGETAPWLYVSPQIEEILGFTPEEWMVRPNIWSRQLHPEDRERVLADEAVSEDTGRPMLAEYRLFAKDGHVVWVRDDSVVVAGPDGQFLLQGVMFDITERKQAEEQLRLAEARYRTLVEQIPAITYIDALSEPFSGEYRCIYVSPQIQQMLGYSPEEFIRQSDLWPLLIHPEDRERVLAADAQHYRTGEPLREEYRLVARDGRVVWVQDNAMALPDETGRLSVTQGLLYDVTERKRMEDDLERALEVERQAAERLRALDELKNTFLHAVSHELRTPLAAVLGFALTLEREEVELSPEERVEIVRRLGANARKLDQLLSDLLDLDRLDRGIMEPRRRPTDLAALVRRTVENSEVLGTRPVWVDADLVVAPVDGPKVERIVENLLANAARHTPAGCSIWVRVAPHEDGVLISVEDDGPGVPEHLREAIFEPFRQGASPSPHSPGVGIGLSLVARFAGLHGGRAWVEHRPGGGAAFKVFLPTAPADYFSTGAPTSEPYSVQEPS